MLIGGYNVFLKSPGRFWAGSTMSGDPAQWGQSGASRGRYFGDGGLKLDPYQATPTGYGISGWLPPFKAGGIASINQIVGTGAVTGALAAGLNGDVALSGVGTVTPVASALGIVSAALAGTTSMTAAISAIASVTGTLAGVGAVSPSIAAVANMAQTLAGSGDLSAAGGLAVFAVAALGGVGSVSAAMGLIATASAALGGVGGLSADAIGALQLATSLSGSGSVAGALGALAEATVAMTGSGSVAAGIRADGNMSADLTPYTELSPQNLANAVWSALSASFNAAGSMGLALANASSAGDPWTTTLAGAYPSGSAGDALVRLYQLAGLDPTKPLVVSTTTRKVPADGSDISQTIADVSGTVTVTRT